MKFLGSKSLETERLILKAQTMEEQQYLWSVLMIPEVNRYYLTVPKKFAEKLKDWSKQEEYYKADMEHTNDSNVFRWSVFLKDTGECIGRVSCHEAKSEGYEIDYLEIKSRNDSAINFLYEESTIEKLRACDLENMETCQLELDESYQEWLK